MIAAATSLIERDLPVGEQITGEEDDPTTIEFALPFASEIDGFVPPPEAAGWSTVWR